MIPQKILDELIEQVERGEQVVESAKIIAKKHGMSHSRLLKWFFVAHPNRGHHRKRVLTELQEEQLKYALLAVSSMNMDWTIRQMQDAAMTMFGVKLHRSAADRFKKRHRKCISFATSKSLAKKRADPRLYDLALAHADQYKQFLDEKKLPASSIVNYDECRIVVTDEKALRTRRLVSRNKHKAQFEGRVKGTHVGTYIPFISATGELLTSYFIFSVKFNEDGEADVPIELPSVFSRTRSGMKPPVIFFNDKGYLNKVNFPKIIDHFTSVWKQNHPGLDCCLIGDNLKTHRNVEVIKKALNNGVYMNFLVQNTTHWSQPLDNLLFARLKQEIKSLAENLAYLQMFTEKHVFSLVDVVLEAAHKAFTHDTVMSAFKSTGLVPFNHDKIEELARKNHDPATDTYVPNERDEYIINKVVKSLTTYLSQVKKEANEKEGKITKVRARVVRNEMYFAEDILAADKKRREEEEKKALETEREKQKKFDERKRKREEVEVKKQATFAARAAKKAQKDEEREKKRRKKETNTCKAKCGRTCKTGPEWVGCSHCETFWVCPECYRKRTVKQQVAKHERECQGK
jgi:hypothetical protein